MKPWITAALIVGGVIAAVLAIWVFLILLAAFNPLYGG